MVSTFTPNGRITKQGTNDSPNTWGTVLNTQVIDLLEDMILGVEPVTITGTSNVTLTTANGSPDQARHGTLELVGTLGADIDLYIPAAEKQYFIRGDWTGAFNVNVKISGSSTEVTIGPGETKIIYANGTDVYDMVDGLRASNNLSDVNDAATSRTNLGLGDMAEYTVGSGFIETGNTLSVAGAGLIGQVTMWPTDTAPSEWAICDGVPLSRTTYADLFSVIGTTYGIGDGATTFNLPDFKGRTAVGAGQGSETAEGDVPGSTILMGDKGGYEEHTLVPDELPAHSHDAGNLVTDTSGAHTHSVTLSTSQFGSTPIVETNGRSNTVTNVPTTSAGAHSHTLLGETADAGGDTGHTNMQPFVGINYIIHTGV